MYAILAIVSVIMLIQVIRRHYYYLLFTSILLFFGSGLYMLSYYQKIEILGFAIFPADMIGILFTAKILVDYFRGLLKLSYKQKRLLYLSFAYIIYVIINLLRFIYTVDYTVILRAVSYEWIYISILLSFAIYIKNKNDLKLIFDVTVYSSIVLGILLLVNDYSVISLYDYARLTTTHKGFLFFFPLIIVLFDKHRYKYIQYPVVLISVIHLFTTTKRSIFIGIAIALLYLLYKNNIFKSKKLIISIIGLTPIIYFNKFLNEFISFYYNYLHSRFVILQNVEDGTSGRRLISYKNSLQVFYDNILFGNIHDLYYGDYTYTLIKVLHSMPLEKLCIYGVFGVLLLSSIFLQTISVNKINQNKYLDEKKVVNALILFSIPVMILNTSWISIYPYAFLGMLFSININVKNNNSQLN